MDTIETKSSLLWVHMIRTAIVLGLFAVAGAGLVVYTYDSTKDKIAEAERIALLNKLHALITSEQYDNDIFNDIIMVKSEKLLGTSSPLPAFRARKNGEPIGIILTVIAPDGYNGDIKLLVGINYNGTIAGARVLNHRETPGLGDAIEERRSHWIYDFNGRSLDNMSNKAWHVKRDGGEFDQFTGATITPRAIVKAVKNSLLYYAENRDHLFEPITTTPPKSE